MKFHKIATFRFRPKLPYDLKLTVRKPAGWHWFTPFEVWDESSQTIWSAFWFKGEPVGVRVGRSGKRLVRADCFAHKRLDESTQVILKQHLEYALGINEDLRPFYRLARNNRILRQITRRLYGMREAWRNDVFSSLTLAILLQMAPVKRSQAMWNCLIKNYGASVSFDGRTVRLWPTAKRVAKLRPDELAKSCRLGYRAKNLVKMATQILSGFPTTAELEKMSPEEARDKLTELYGIGEYSAGFATPHPSFSIDVWSVKIFHPLIFGKAAPKKDPRSAIERTARAAERLWGRWRSYVLTYVLNDLPYLEEKFGIAAEGTQMLK